MFLELEECELRELINLLEDSITSLRAELRRTEDAQFKEWLRQRLALLERMLEHCLSAPMGEK